MAKWANYLISAVSYDPERQIISLKRHEDFGDKIGPGEIIDKASVASHIANGVSYMTIYSTKSNWKLGEKIRLSRVDNHYSLRIDDNKVKHDYLGPLTDLGTNSQLEISPKTKKIPDNSNLQISQQDKEMLKNMGAQQKGSIMSLETKSEKTDDRYFLEIKTTKKSKVGTLAEYENDYLKRLENEPKQEEPLESPHGTLPKGFDKTSSETIETPEPKQEEPLESPQGTLPKGEQYPHKIQKTEISDKQSSELNDLEKQIGELKKAVEKLDDSKPTTSSTKSTNVQAYCVKCKAKRDVKEPIQTKLKNGRPAIKGTCSKCGTKMSRLGKL